MAVRAAATEVKLCKPALWPLVALPSWVLRAAEADPAHLAAAVQEPTATGLLVVALAAGAAHGAMTVRPPQETVVALALAAVAFYRVQVALVQVIPKLLVQVVAQVVLAVLVAVAAVAVVGALRAALVLMVLLAALAATLLPRTEAPFL